MCACHVAAGTCSTQQVACAVQQGAAEAAAAGGTARGHRLRLHTAAAGCQLHALLQSPHALPGHQGRAAAAQGAAAPAAPAEAPHCGGASPGLPGRPHDRLLGAGQARAGGRPVAQACLSRQSPYRRTQARVMSDRVCPQVCWRCFL
jgi:hypothetical protein